MCDTNSGDPRGPVPDSITHEALASKAPPSEIPHLVTATGTNKPAQLCRQLQATTRAHAKTRVLAANEHVAAAVHRIAKHPVKQTTARGVTPYRTTHPLQTPGGKYVVRDVDTPPIGVEFVAQEGVELTVSDTTMQLPFGDIPADAFTDLPDGLFLADQTATDGDVSIMDGDGTEITTVPSQRDRRAGYPCVRDWFQPDRLSYRGDITIHYPDPATEDDLQTYEDPATQPQPARHATLREFLEQCSVSAHGTGLDTGEVFDRYTAWLTTTGQSPPDRAAFGRALAKLDVETATRVKPAGQQVICDRTWRYPPTLDR